MPGLLFRRLHFYRPVPSTGRRIYSIGNKIAGRTQLVVPETAPGSYNTLFPGGDTVLNAKVELGDWGYFYVPPGPCDEEADPFCINQIPADIIRNNNLPIPPQLN